MNASIPKPRQPDHPPPTHTGGKKASSQGQSNTQRRRRARAAESPAQKSLGWSIWVDLSGCASEDVYDSTLQVRAECSSSAQFHERWAALKRESIECARIRVFRTGVLPFRTLSKMRGGESFCVRCTQAHRQQMQQHVLARWCPRLWMEICA